ncbi:MAG: GNAT family N-acetyltransferase [Oscillospiraceae bacterium]|jgi:ribosomal protein S18 acetylase RimI-like enzyme|nr:GNAT family N-acetyltransferase [Oscillospiraceae bacterium]MDD3260336.1 GNAT family N-acetyltransferase [Oscillospiraceae bacterium]
MEYRIMTASESERIKEIDAEWYIGNAWRTVEGKRILVPVNWEEHELPNGLPWHMEHFENTIKGGGTAVGCFDDGALVGYGMVNAEVFGESRRYVLLDQLFVSHEYRSRGIGKKLVEMLKDAAREHGADKIYVCAASAEDTVAFYRKAGFQDATEINNELFAADPNDLQMELAIC